MKKLSALVLAVVCVFCLAGCADDETAVWTWAQNVSRDDILSVIPRSDVNGDDYQEFEPLDDAETLELVALLNELTEDSFTHNQNLAGITPSYHIELNLASETYYINEANAPNGALEMQYNEEQWWIDSAALMEFVQRVTNHAPAA